MRNHEIEEWALQVVDQVTNMRTVEDVRVELKRVFPHPERAARILAGHANAARGDDLIWILGLDETTGPVGVDEAELADWLPALRAKFDGVSPDIHDLRVPTHGVMLTVLHVSTDRAPFVVRNPVYGQQGGGPVELEVPWRDGTATRTARREDLLRLLSPLRRSPAFEVLWGRASLRNVGHGVPYWELTMDLYQRQMLEHPVVVPFHHCRATLVAGTFPPIDLNDLRLELQVEVRAHHAPSMSLEDLFDSGKGGGNRTTHEIRESGQLTFRGPARVTVSASAETDREVYDRRNEISSVTARLMLPAVEAASPEPVEAVMSPHQPVDTMYQSDLSWGTDA